VVLFYLLVMGLAVVASITDVSSRIIPNWVSAAIAALFPLYVVIFASYDFAASGAAAAGLVLAVGLVLFALGWFGGGDVKLMAALALWVGLDGLAAFSFLTSLIGGGIAAVMLLLYWRKIRQGERLTVPYGVAISLAGLSCLLLKVGN